MGRMVTTGELKRGTHVWTQGQDGWKTAEDVQELDCELADATGATEDEGELSTAGWNILGVSGNGDVEAWQDA